MMYSYWLTCLRTRRLWSDFQHGHFTPFHISIQHAESLAKCPITLEIAQFTPSFTTQLATLREKRMNIAVSQW